MAFQTFPRGGDGDILTDPAWTAKGELVVGTGNSSADILPVGTDGQIPYANSSAPTGIEWNDAPTAGLDPDLTQESALGSVTADTLLHGTNPPTSRVIVLVADSAGAEGSYLKVYDSQTSTYVIDASISATGDIDPGMDGVEFATNIAAYLDANKALFGSPTVEDGGGYVTLTWPVGTGQTRWGFETDDPVLGIGPTEMVVAGAGTATVNRTFPVVTNGTNNGRINYYMTGDQQLLYWDGTRWLFYDGSDGSEYYFSTDDVASPDLVTTWEVGTDGTGPVPTVTASPEGTDAEWGNLPISSLPGGGGGVETIVAGTNITVDATDPANPIVSSTGGGDILTDPAWQNKGDLVIGTGSATAEIFPAGTNGYTLAYNDGEDTGFEIVDPSLLVQNIYTVDHTLDTGDSGKEVQATAACDLITVDDTAALGVGFICSVINLTTTPIVIDAVGGVTLVGNVWSLNQYQSVRIRYIDADTYLLTFDEPPPIVVLTDAATIAVDATLGKHFRVTVTDDREIGAPTGLQDGMHYTFEVIQGGAGNYDTTLDAIFVFGTEVTGFDTTGSATGGIDYFTAIYNAGTGNMNVVGVGTGY